jgi:hypothetical protein
MANNSLKQKSKRLMTIITYSIPNICQSHLSFKNWKVCHQDPFSIAAIAVAQSSDVFLISNVFLRILLNVQAHQNGFIPLVASWCSTGFVGEFGRYQRLQNISRQTTSNQVYTGFNIHFLLQFSSSGNDNKVAETHYLSVKVQMFVAGRISTYQYVNNS